MLAGLNYHGSSFGLSGLLIYNLPRLRLALRLKHQFAVSVERRLPVPQHDIDGVAVRINNDISPDSPI